MNAILHAQQLTKHYPGGVALDHVDFTAQAGESIAIIGPSGSGKTTLLHCLAGILRPDAGSVTLGRQAGALDLRTLSDAELSKLRRQEFGFVFQQGMLLPELTALENVALPLMLTGTDRRTSESRAAEWLAALGLAGKEKRRLGELSGGQVQRVAIARAQVTGARVIFADEPTGALDSATSSEVLDVLLRSVAANGRTLLVVTHDPNVAERCGRVVELRDGRIIADSAGLGSTAASGNYNFKGAFNV
ncbi:ABC transporter ATP-binding protein [Paenarthrobacter ureafaciens]|jgi:putative ABC transport system ATP-binding protein|uniref:ABC transporter ATP-binding protein n=1 Tax=Paenarthrobacter ureafaciens TaxID=37931 RepID=UPI00140E1CA1|nr:ABC transporter ATP-binding protein [Paenarthrobacter ureafaciens]MCX8455814.1 ABC transporter ATP-binding protein [Paenarthrobacter ureafaciens]MCY0973950.1 ABC transporter ATP-binding protein [Paenarthrobacter ureafaciens]